METFITAREAAAMLGYTPDTLRDVRTRARLNLPAHRLPTGAIRFDKRDVLRLLRREAEDNSTLPALRRRATTHTEEAS